MTTTALADRAAAVRQAHINKTLHSEFQQIPLVSKSNEDAKGHSPDNKLGLKRQEQEAQVPSNAKDCAIDNNLNTSLASGKPTLSREEHELFEWFLQLQKEQLPVAPFELSPGIKVINRDVFFASLKRDALAGSNSARARTGALQQDLFMLRELIARNSANTGEISTKQAYQAWLAFYNIIRPRNQRHRGYNG